MPNTETPACPPEYGAAIGSAPHPADYVTGMAPRTDATDKGTANLNARHAYIIMRAHARALEIELREAQNKVL